jgi:hypothetical protein
MGKKIASLLLASLGCLLLIQPETGLASIGNIKEFLNTCPQNDPAYNQIRSDFTIRHNGIVVGNIACSEPTSSMNLAQYTDELIVLQILRVMYYMDYGQAGHLPWTPAGTLYQWMKSKIKGFNIKDTATDSSCCDNSFPGGLYITLWPSDDLSRSTDRLWRGIAQYITLLAHETRHVDGFPHPSCCIYPRCDQTFDQSNLSPIGIQWWLNKLFLTGEINVGASCLDAAERQETINWNLAGTNGEIKSFCDNTPPTVSVPAAPLGLCLGAHSLPWKVTTVDSALDYGQYAAIAIDPGNDIPYISYYDATSAQLRLASPVPPEGGNCGPNNSWWCRTMDESNHQVGKYSSLAISIPGTAIWKLGISYIDEANHALKYYSYYCNILGCHSAIETIDSNVFSTRFTSLKFDSGGSPHIAYQVTCGPLCILLKYASYVGNGGNCGAG